MPGAGPGCAAGYGPGTGSVPVNVPRAHRQQLAGSQGVPGNGAPRPATRRGRADRAFPPPGRKAGENGPAGYLPVPVRRRAGPRARFRRVAGAYPGPVRRPAGDDARCGAALPQKPGSGAEPHHAAPAGPVVSAGRDAAQRKPGERHRLFQDRIQHLRSDAGNPVLQPGSGTGQGDYAPLHPRPLRREH